MNTNLNESQAMASIQNELSSRIKSVWAETRRSMFRGSSMFIYVETKDLTLTPYDVIKASKVPFSKVFVNIETPRTA